MPLAAPADGSPAAPAGTALVPAGGSPLPLIETLRATIRAIERRNGLPPDAGAAAGPVPLWQLGEPTIDHRLGPRGLDPSGIHEIKPEDDPSRGAALGFALRLAVRHLDALAAVSRGNRHAGHILWCASPRTAAESGRLHAPGLVRLGLDPARFVSVETGRTADVLWAIEEGIKSQGLLLVIALIDEVPGIAARRLALAAESGHTPALLVTCHAREAAAATASRWRVGARPSGPHPFDPRAPGPPRFGLALERCRNRPLDAETAVHAVEWSDETHRFRVATAVADRADAAPEPGRRAAG